MDRPEAAAEYMRRGWSCAQSVVKAFAADLETGEEAAVRMAAALGGGFGRCGHLCGALSGAAIVIGDRLGSADPADTETRDRAYAAVRRLLERFQREHGSVLCRELTGIDMRNPEALKRAREEKMFAEKCPRFIESSGRILEEILEGK